MKGRFRVAYVIFGLLLFSFPAQQGMAAELVVEKETVTDLLVGEKVVKTVNNFIVFFNSASSMNKSLKGSNMTRIQLAKEFLKEKNAAMPDLAYKAGLYLFNPFSPVYNVKTYDKKIFGEAIDSLPDTGSGPTLIQEALHKLDPILAGLSGRTAVFVFWSGIYADMGSYKKPARQAKELAQKYDVFFHVIDVEEDNRGDEELNGIASVSEWGRVIPIEELINKPETTTGALYVMTPTAVKTTRTVAKIVSLNVDNILFDINSSVLRSDFYDELGVLGSFLNSHPKAYVIISGHTDNVGEAKYNLWLSRRRALSVEKYLMMNGNVNGERIVVQWYGESLPSATNSTPEGRGLNRRVESIVMGLD